MEWSGAVESQAAGPGMRSAVRGWAGGPVRGVRAGGGSGEVVLGRKAQLDQGRVAAAASRGDRRCRDTAVTELIQSVWTGRWEKG